MLFDAHRGPLFAIALLALAPVAHAGDIIVTGDRPDPCEADPWCTPGTYDDLTPDPVIVPPSPTIGGGGGGGGGLGNEIIVERDREQKEEEDEEEECEEQSINSAFLNGGGIPNTNVILHGELHDDFDMVTDDDDQRANAAREQDLVDRAGEDGSRVCVGIEFGRGAQPNTSQEDMYAYADANGIPTFNMDPTQAAGQSSATCNNETYDRTLEGHDEQTATNCLNTRDQLMASSIAMALAYGVDGNECDRVVAIVGDAHTSQTISTRHAGTNPFDRQTLADLLRGLGFDPFVDNRTMYADVCVE